MKKWYRTQIEFSDILDQISIIQVKYDNATEDSVKSKLGEKLRVLEQMFEKGSGLKSYQIIMRSREYNDLYEANLAVFKGVDVAKNDPEGKIISGFALDKLNTKRNEMKRAISQKFLGEDPEEIKIKDGKKI